MTEYSPCATNLEFDLKPKEQIYFKDHFPWGLGSVAFISCSLDVLLNGCYIPEENEFDWHTSDLDVLRNLRDGLCRVKITTKPIDVKESGD